MRARLPPTAAAAAAAAQVNAWTVSRVQRALLKQFCRCEASLPNFWVRFPMHTVSHA
jgi:hypothetical protein